MLKQFKLQEALDWLSSKTGRTWSDSELFQSCVDHHVSLRVVPPLDAGVAVIRLFPSDGPLINDVVRRMGWHPGVLYPFNVGQLWQIGEAEPHPVLRQPLEDGRMAVFDPPFRARRDHLAIEIDSLKRVLEAWTTAEPNSEPRQGNPAASSGAFPSGSLSRKEKRYSEAELKKLLCVQDLAPEFPYHHVRGNDGLYVKAIGELSHEARTQGDEDLHDLRWCPAGDHRAALPFPFTARELAAFMLHSSSPLQPGRWPIEDLDDSEALKRHGLSHSPRAVEVLKSALRLLSEAERLFPFPDAPLLQSPDYFGEHKLRPETQVFDWKVVDRRAAWLLKDAHSKTDALQRTPPTPHFITSARPTAVPLELLALSPDDDVSFRCEFPPFYECSAYKVADYKADIEARMARQAEGFFTLNEAGQILADSRPGMKAVDAVKRMRLAHSKGELPIHQAVTRFPLEAGEAVSDWRDLLEMTELDAWLWASVGYGFPDAENDCLTNDAKALLELPPPAVRTHQLRRRADPLREVIMFAASRAVNSADWPSVWAALVAHAQSSDRRAPLLGYSEGDGVKYQTDNPDAPVKWLSRDAFRKRCRRESDRAAPKP